MADHPRFFDAERNGESMHADRGSRHVQTVRGDSRVSDAGEVRRDHHESPGQHGDDRFPHAGGLGVAGQQDERRAVAGGHALQLHPVDFSRARNDGRVGRVGDECSKHVLMGISLFMRVRGRAWFALAAPGPF
jgi:hypothetical protein